MCCRYDPFGIFCFLFLYILISYVDYAFIVYVLPYDDVSQLCYYLLFAGYQLVLLMFIWSHLMCVFSDPGIVDLKNKLLDCDRLLNNCSTPVENGQKFPFNSNNSYKHKRNYVLDLEWTFCRSCHIYRPPRAHHCDICRRCILQMDHHCPWINNCVGEYNQRYFLQFTAYAFATSIFTIAGIITSFIVSTSSSPIRIINIAILLMSSVIFGIFSVAVISDQIQTDNKHGFNNSVDRDKERTCCKVIRHICGSRSIICWLFPLPVAPKSTPEIDVEMKHVQQMHSP